MEEVRVVLRGGAVVEDVDVRPARVREVERARREARDAVGQPEFVAERLRVVAPDLARGAVDELHRRVLAEGRDERVEPREVEALGAEEHVPLAAGACICRRPRAFGRWGNASGRYPPRPLRR